MLHYKTEAVRVVGYRARTGRDKTPQTWKSGAAKEVVQFAVDGEGRYRELLLHESVNGSRAAEGALVSLTVRTIIWEDAAKSQSGEPYIRRSVLESVVGMEPVKA